MDLFSIPYVEARWKTVLPANPHRSIDLIVIHSMEAPEKGSTAENVARYFQNVPRRASAHFNVDNDSVVASVLIKDVAYHAPGANRKAIGIEHAGYARQSRDEWLDPYGIEMLRRSADLTATLCSLFAIPVRFVTAAQLTHNVRGITTHHEVSQAWKQSDHWDPGPHFPMGDYLAWVNEHLAPPPTQPPAPVRVPVIDVAIDPRTGGTYGVDIHGVVFCKAHGGPAPTHYGDAVSAGVRTDSIIAMCVTDTGYILMGRDGGVFNFNTPFHGSYPGLPAEHRVGAREFIDVFATPGGGYTLVADDLGQYHFGP